MSTRAQLGEQIALLMQELIASAVLTNERIARQVGLNVVDFQTYGVLLRQGEPMTPGQLAQVTELPSSTTTRVLDRLEAKGMVRRSPTRPTAARPGCTPYRSTIPRSARPTRRSCARWRRSTPASRSRSSRPCIRYLDAIKDVR